MSRPQKRKRTPIRTVEGAGGVVINAAGRVLMIRHKNGTWVFPKGHIEPGEAKTQTAEREVQEEAGVSANVLDPRMTWQTDYVNPRREARRITWYLLTTDATSTVQTEPLFPEGGFFPPATAMRKLAFDEDRGVLRGALKAADRADLLAPGDLAKAVHVASTTRGRASAQRDQARDRKRLGTRQQGREPEARRPPVSAGAAALAVGVSAGTNNAAGANDDNAAGTNDAGGGRTKRRRRRGRPRRGSRRNQASATPPGAPRDDGGEA